MSLSRILANIGTALDSATTGDFLSKVDSDGVFGGVAYSSVTGTPTVLDSASVTNLIDSAYVQLRQSAVSGGGLDSAGVTAILDSDYITNITTASGFQMFEYDATAGQTDFTGSDINGNTLAYSEYGLLVHYNGILLSGATDYTATDGSTVVLTDSADEGARITIAKWSLASAGGGSSFAWGGDRGIFAGGELATYTATSEYISISSPGNSTDFGDLTTARMLSGSCSNSTYGLWAGGLSYTTQFNYWNVIDYLTFATIGNGSDFGDLTVGRRPVAACSDGTYGLFGASEASSGEAAGNVIDYVTIATPGNATDFGDHTFAGWGKELAAAADATYGLFAGGYVNDGVSTYNNSAIDYVTIASPGNASDFGDLTAGRTYGGRRCGGLSNDTYALFFGGLSMNVIDYVTIASPGNATDFGDLSVTADYPCGCSDNTYGVIQTSSGGGGSNTSTVEYVAIATPGNTTDFGNLGSDDHNRYGAAASSGSPS